MSEWTKPEYKCVVTGQAFATLHHIYTQKAHPELKHEPRNLLPLIHPLHMECHKIGLTAFANKYPRVKSWLIEKGWEKDNWRSRWTHSFS